MEEVCFRSPFVFFFQSVEQEKEENPKTCLHALADAMEAEAVILDHIHIPNHYNTHTYEMNGNNDDDDANDDDDDCFGLSHS